MQRLVVVGLVVLAAWASAPEEAVAQSKIQTTVVDHVNRIAGFDKDLVKPFSVWTVVDILCVVLATIVYLCWVRGGDWVNQDRFLQRKSRNWNLAIFFPFAMAFLLVWIIPIFWAGWPLAILAFAIPFFVYVAQRNARVNQEQRVFTGPHLRFWLARKLRTIGIKIQAEAKSIDELGPPVRFKPTAAPSDRENNILLLTARQAPGYLPARELIQLSREARADAVMLDFTQQAVAQRYLVDGVWHQAEGHDRETGDAVLAVLKVVAALNPQERRARQHGSFALELNGKKLSAKMTSQGVPAGERVVLQYLDPADRHKRLADLGMRPKMIEDLKPKLDERHGIVVVSAPPAGGLTSLLAATLAEMDRYMRGFVAVEEVSSREIEIENVPVTTFDVLQGQSPADMLPKLIREHPDVYVVPDIKDAQTANILMSEVTDDRIAVTTVRAKEASEALLRLFTYKISADQVAELTHVVVNQRLVRKLCDACKQPYAPPPAFLQQLGIPSGRLEALYQPPVPDPERPQEVCAQCRGVGYLGRTGVFEMLVIDDEIRDVLRRKPQVDTVRQAARKGGMRTLQEEGLVLVVKGITSLAELSRVLKE